MNHNKQCINKFSLKMYALTNSATDSEKYFPERLKKI